MSHERKNIAPRTFAMVIGGCCCCCCCCCGGALSPAPDAMHCRSPLVLLLSMTTRPRLLPLLLPLQRRAGVTLGPRPLRADPCVAWACVCGGCGEQCGRVEIE